MEREKPDLKSELGILTIEASLALSFFIFAILSWILLMHIINLESLSAHALDQAALELSDQISMAHTLKNKDPASYVNSLAKSRDMFFPEILEEYSVNRLMELNAENLFYKNFADGKYINCRISNIDIETYIDDELDRLSLSLEYDISLPGILKILGPRSIKKHTTAGIWLLTDDPIIGFDKEDDKKNKEEEKSIWDLAPFKRGKILVNRRIERQGGSKFKKGQILDRLVNSDTGEAIFSWKLFTKSYSSGQGQRAADYKLKEKEIIKYLEDKAKTVLEARNKRKEFELEDGRKVTGPKNLQILIIMPLEAEIFEERIGLLAKGLEDKYDIKFNFVREEKAFTKGEENEETKE